MRYSTSGEQNLETSLDIVHKLFFLQKVLCRLSCQMPLFYPAGTAYNQPAVCWQCRRSATTPCSIRCYSFQCPVGTLIFRVGRRVLFSKDCTFACRMEGSGGVFNRLRILRRQRALWTLFLRRLLTQMMGIWACSQDISIRFTLGSSDTLKTRSCVTISPLNQLLDLSEDEALHQKINLL